MHRNVVGVLASAALLSGCAGTVRYSQNPIGKAQFVGVAVCDDPGKARQLSDAGLRRLVPYPLFVRTDWRPLSSRGSSGARAVASGGRTWTSGLHEAMGLTERDEPFVVLVLDRRGRIRGFTSALGGASPPEADPASALAGIVEDLLLNLDGAEVITRHRPPGGPAGAPRTPGAEDGDAAFQTDLDPTLAEDARRGPGKGAARARVMRLLGKPLPDWTVRDAAGAKVSLRAVAAGKVTVLAIFLAQDGAPADLEPAFAELRSAWRDFGEGRARPGPRWVANARPDAP